MIEQGEVRWADLPETDGPILGGRRPVVVVQNDHINRTRLQTIVCVLISPNLDWVELYGNVLLKTASTELKQDSVALVSQVRAISREFLGDRIARVSPLELAEILGGIDFVLGR